MTNDLPAGIGPFLARIGWGGAQVSAIPGDASFRRYFRVTDGARRAFLMHAPPPHEDPKPFVDVTEYLLAQNMRAPVIYGFDYGEGLLLLEDFGDDRMRERLDSHPDEEEMVYRTAIDALIALGKAPVADVPPYDMSAYMREVSLLTQWYLPAMCIDADRREYEALWAGALAPLLADPPAKVTVLRDYHAENIMLLEGGAQGIIDYQDALVGHPAYDLVSLLQDARRDVSPALEARMLAYYQERARPEYDFALHYALLGAQRNTKIIGIFTRLWERDGKPRYLDFLPRMWGLLERDLAQPGLEPLRGWFDRMIPPAVRKASPLDFAA